MAKIVIHVALTKIRIMNVNGLSETKTIWPEGWIKEKADVVAYQGMGNLFGTYNKGCIAVIDESDRETFLALDGVTGITDEVANSLGQKWKPQIVKLVKEGPVIEILAKVALGDELTADDRKVIDPDDPELGLNRTPVFDIARYKE